MGKSGLKQPQRRFRRRQWHPHGVEADGAEAYDHGHAARARQHGDMARRTAASAQCRRRNSNPFRGSASAAHPRRRGSAGRRCSSRRPGQWRSTRSRCRAGRRRGPGNNHRRRLPSRRSRPQVPAPASSASWPGSMAAKAGAFSASSSSMATGIEHAGRVAVGCFDQASRAGGRSRRLPPRARPALACDRRCA